MASASRPPTATSISKLPDPCTRNGMARPIPTRRGGPPQTGLIRTAQDGLPPRPPTIAEVLQDFPGFAIGAHARGGPRLSGLPAPLRCSPCRPAWRGVGHGAHAVGRKRGPIVSQHRFQHLQTRTDGKFEEFCPRIDQEVDQPEMKGEIQHRWDDRLCEAPSWRFFLGWAFRPG